MVRRYWIIAVVLFFGEAWAQDKNDPLRLVTFWAGTLPIILSAPHGGRELIPGIPVRKGQGVAQFTTERDNNTAELAEQVGARLAIELGGRPFLVVARFERKYIDANRAPTAAYESPTAKLYYDGYHQALGEACRRVQQRWRRGLLLDLHGQGAEPETIFRGTDNGKSVSDLERRFGRGALTGGGSILGQLVFKGYKIAPDGAANDLERRYTGGFTTRTYGSHRGTGIDAIQLELGTTLRQRANLTRTAADLAEAVAVFAKRYLPLTIKPQEVQSGAIDTHGVVE
jgi:N-formylglutamate amidohydrolase